MERKRMLQILKWEVDKLSAEYRKAKERYDAISHAYELVKEERDEEAE